MALINATLLLLRTHFTRVLLSRRTALCALISLAPVAIASLILLADEKPPPAHEVATVLGWMLLLQIVVPLNSLIAGSAVISEEIDDRTITYLFTRPFPRAALLLGRWIATAAILALLCGGSALLLTTAVNQFGPAAETPLSAEGITWPLFQMAVLGGAVYSALFAVIGVFLKRPMIVGLAYTFVIEGVLSNIPGKSQGLAVVYHLRSYVASASELWNMVGEESSIVLEPQADSIGWLLRTLALALVLGSLLVSRRQYVLTA